MLALILYFYILLMPNIITSFRLATTMDNDDSNSCYELISSQGRREEFSKVPEDIVFRFKVIDKNETKKIAYKLKEGVELPCEKDVGGYLRTY